MAPNDDPTDTAAALARRMPQEAARTELRRVFAGGGARDALAFLNSLTGFRFSSLYRFDDATLRKITFFDREQPQLDECEEIPVMASYCVFVRDSGLPFRMADSQSDPRVALHPKRNVVQSYCGVPLRDREGRMFGSACHFDYGPGAMLDEDAELLEMMADLIQKGS